jgi:hypothetical protein
VELLPASMWTNEPLGAVACEKAFHPQQVALPWSSRTHVCSSPAAMAARLALCNEGEPEGAVASAEVVRSALRHMKERT